MPYHAQGIYYQHHQGSGTPLVWGHGLFGSIACEDEAGWLAQVDAAVNRSVQRLALGGRPDLAAEMLTAHIVKTETVRTRVHGPASSYVEAARRFNSAAAACAVRLLEGAA